MLSEALLEATEGRTREGSPIWRPDDSTGDKIYKGMVHVSNAFMPGTFPVKADPRVIGGGEGPVRAGPLATAVEGTMGGSGIDYRGKRRELAGELVSGALAINETHHNLLKSLGYLGQDIQHRVKNIPGQFAEPLLRGGEVSPEEMVRSFNSTNASKFKIMQELHLHINNMRTLGKSDDEIFSTLVDSNLSKKDLGAAMGGEFIPYFPAKETVLAIEKYPEILPESQRNKVPFDALGAEEDRWFGLRLDQNLGDQIDPDVLADEEEPVSAVPSQPEPVAQAPASAPTPVALAPTPTPAPGTSLSQTSVAGQRSPAELAALGLESPLEQAIAARQQRRVG